MTVVTGSMDGCRDGGKLCVSFALLSIVLGLCTYFRFLRDCAVLLLPMEITKFLLRTSYHGVRRIVQQLVCSELHTNGQRLISFVFLRLGLGGPL